jgi:hypothetical protein
VLTFERTNARIVDGVCPLANRAAGNDERRIDHRPRHHHERALRRPWMRKRQRLVVSLNLVVRQDVDIERAWPPPNPSDATSLLLARVSHRQ